MEMLTLYRGDSTVIEEFKFKKTHRWCLWGPGVYLTDSRQVAESYRAKDADGTHVQGETNLAYAKTPGEAKKNGLARFLDMHSHEGHLRLRYKVRENKVKPARVVERLTDKFYAMIESREIKIEPSHDSFSCRWDLPMRSGAVSEFRFPREHFLRNCLRSGVTRIQEIAEFIADYREGGKQFCVAPRATAFPLEDYPYYYIDNLVLAAPYTLMSRDQFTAARARLRWLMEPLGIHGIEYKGGQMTGNSIRHRAFVIWDENYVNKHRIGGYSNA